jgi:glycosyltransferase involved in cell wall biosynthesis
MTRTENLVTVIVPAYNAAQHLRHTLESIRRQTYPSIEVLVVDDGSTDATPDVAAEFARLDPRFRTIRQANAGVGAARNTAIRHARGEFIAPVDADDVWYPRKLEKQVACMRVGGDAVGLVYCWYVRIDDEGREIGYSTRVDIEGWIREAMVFRNFVGNASVPLIRARVLEDVGLYLTRAEQGGSQGCEDRDLNLRIAERAEFRVVPEYLVKYRQRKTAMSANPRGMRGSFRVVTRRAKDRNPDLPRRLFRWSRGAFHAYQMRKCYRLGNYGGCLRCIGFAALADPVMLLDVKLHSLLVRAAIKAALRLPPDLRRRWREGGTRHSPALASPAPADRLERPNALYRRIEQRRWMAAIPSRVLKAHPAGWPAPRSVVNSAGRPSP